MGNFLLGTTLEAGMFKNILLTGVSLVVVASDVQNLNSDGYPTTTLSSNVGLTLKFGSNSSASTTYVLKGSGKCDLWLSRGSPGFTVVSDANSVVNGSASFNLRITNSNPALSWRVTFKFATSVPSSVTFAFLAGFAFDGSLSGLVLCRDTDETSIDSATVPGDYFADDYVTAYTDLGPRIIRPMGWSGPNSGNVSKSAYVPNWSTSLNISSSRYEPAAIAGDTGGSVDTYTCSLHPDAANSLNGQNPSTYTQGEMIHLRVLTANTVSTGCTLNSGGRGAKPIKIGFGSNTGLNPTTSGSTQITVGWHTFTYDDVAECFWWQAGEQTACVPYELQAGFANRIGADLWINFHSQMDEASMVAITQSTDQYLSIGSILYVEYGNEQWNNGFPATKMSVARGAALGFPSANSEQLHGWYGLQLRRLMPQITANGVLTRPRSNIRAVMAVQFQGSTSNAKIYRMEGKDLAPSGTSTGVGNAKYVSFDGGNYTQSGNRPIDVCDVFSYATYFGGAQAEQFDATYITRFGQGLNINGLTAAADDYASGVQSQIDSALSWIDTDIRTGLKSNGVSGAETLASNLIVEQTWETILSGYDSGRSSDLAVVCYEGGPGAVAPSTSTCTSIGISTSYGGVGGKIDNLLAAWKNSQLSLFTTRKCITDFASNGHSSVSGWLLLPGSSSPTSNPWCLNAGDTFSSHFAAWYALELFGRGKRRLAVKT